jgi:hypothetical protein
MKKNRTALLLFFSLCVRVYSFEESWISWGFEYGNSFEARPNPLNPLETSTRTLGVNFSHYAFPASGAFGYFLHNSMLYASPMPVKNGNKNFTGIQNESTLGGVFRFAFTDRLKLLLSLGLNFMALKYLYNGVPEEGAGSMESINFGFGGGAVLKYEAKNKKVFYSIGLRATLHCLNRTSVLSHYTEDSRWSWNLLLGVKPYISFGLNLFNTGTQLGLPEEQAAAP